MRELKLATGRSRWEKKWKNQEVSWSELVGILSETHRTVETQAEYRAMSKNKQDTIKDIGGFVGGALKDGHRQNGNVLCRSMLTLDLDFAGKDFWDDFIMLNDYAACVYSTHKHTNDKPRLRLIVPLARDVGPEEYEAIARRVAGDIGIDQFDDTTFQPTRLMYWPSTSKDGEYFFRCQEGEWLEPDEVLARYNDWRDCSFWPESSRAVQKRHKLADRQGDPLSKEGLIGAFCRTYSIQEAIEKFLPDVYEPCSMENRYTYIGGSTATGLVLYEDKFAYSNHSTDPASGILCNAFDLVRIHKFGELDEEVKENTTVSRLPSMAAMLEFVGLDEETKKTNAHDKVESAKQDFKDVGMDDDDEDWISKLKTDKKGNFESTIDNCVIVLQNDPRFKGKIALNELYHQEEATQDLPWRKGTRSTQALQDNDDAAIRHYFERIYKITGKDKIKDAVEIVAQRNSYHPVRQYLDQVEWDGHKRLDKLLIDYLGADDNEYVRAVTRKTLVAAVARVYEPGIKFDTMLTLTGAQGIGKSTMFDRLGKDWFSDSLTTVSGKEAYEQLQGVWIMEMGELKATKKAEVESVKLFLSKREDRYRLAYGRRTGVFPRQCIFVGTTNKPEFLRDETGGRRFWIVEVTESRRSVWNDFTPDFVDQIWAEAKEYYRQGEPLYLSIELEKVAKEIQSDHTEENPLVGIIERYLDILLPKDWDKRSVYDRRRFINGDEFSGPDDSGTELRTKVCALEIFSEALGKESRNITRYDTMEINSIMDSLPNWERSSGIRTGGYGRQRGYKRKMSIK